MKNEEQMILDQILSEDEKVLSLTNQMKKLKLELDITKARQTNARQALIDYYKACGVSKSECGDYVMSISKTKSVDVLDIDSVPEKYVRTKTTKEVNKALIKAEGLEANNWLQYKETPKLTIKHKEG